MSLAHLAEWHAAQYRLLWLTGQYAAAALHRDAESACRAAMAALAGKA